MPYPGEHSCRIHSPDLYQKESFRRIKRGKYSMVIAKRPGKDTTEVQAFRYPISDWAEDAAENHCKDQGGTFEAAAGEEKIKEISAEELLELAGQNPELADYQLVEKALGEDQDVCGTDIWVCSECGEEVEHERGAPCAEAECPECGVAMVGKEKQEEKVVEEKTVKKETAPILSKFYSLKARDGRSVWVALSGSSYEDREGEIIARKAIDYGIAHADKSGQRGELRLYHYPASKVGECKFQMRVGQFLVEAGLWDDTPRAERTKKWVEENEAGVSVGFFYNPEKFVDSVYTDEVIFFERSVLKRKHASCPWASARTISRRLQVSHKKDLVDLLGGDEVAEQEAKAVLEGAKDASKDLEGQGVAFKEDQEKAQGKGLLEQVKDLSEDDLKALYTSVGKLLRVEEKEVGEKEVKEEVVGEKQEDKEKQVETPEEVQFRLDDAAIKAIAEAVKEMLPDNSELEAEIKALKEATESASKVLTEQVETKVKEVFEDLPKATIYRATKVTEEELKEEPGTAWVNPLERSLEDGIREIEKAREAGR